MALRINQADPVAIGERWEDFDDDTKFLIRGIDDEDYQICLERARRLIAREDAGQSLANITATASDQREHDIQCQLLGKFIVKDWKGEVLDDDDRYVAYSQEAAAKLLKANVGVFAWVISMATKVAIDKNTEVAETVGKALDRFRWEREWQDKGKKRTLIYSKLGMGVPNEPPTDAITDHVMGVFWAANRARRYLAGKGGAVALPLSSVEISQAIDAYGSPLSRFELDACVMAMDREYLAGG